MPPRGTGLAKTPLVKSSCARSGSAHSLSTGLKTGPCCRAFRFPTIHRNNRASAGSRADRQPVPVNLEQRVVVRIELALECAAEPCFVADLDALVFEAPRGVLVRRLVGPAGQRDREAIGTEVARRADALDLVVRAGPVPDPHMTCVIGRVEVQLDDLAFRPSELRCARVLKAGAAPAPEQHRLLALERRAALGADLELAIAHGPQRELHATAGRERDAERIGRIDPVAGLVRLAAPADVARAPDPFDVQRDGGAVDRDTRAAEYLDLRLCAHDAKLEVAVREQIEAQRFAPPPSDERRRGGVGR